MSSTAAASTAHHAHTTEAFEQAVLSVSEESFPLKCVDYPSEKVARMICKCMSTDLEIRPDQVHRVISVSERTLFVHISTQRTRLLRAAVQGFMENLLLATETVRELGPPQHYSAITRPLTGTRRGPRQSLAKFRITVALALMLVVVLSGTAGCAEDGVELSLQSLHEAPRELRARQGCTLQEQPAHAHAHAFYYESRGHRRADDLFRGGEEADAEADEDDIDRELNDTVSLIIIAFFSFILIFLFCCVFGSVFPAKCVTVFVLASLGGILWAVQSVLSTARLQTLHDDNRAPSWFHDDL